MKISVEKPFKLIYSIYEHEYLGFLFESFVVQQNDRGSLTLLHQNISSQNANEFSKNFRKEDFEIIKIIDEINQSNVVKYFNTGKMDPEHFFIKTYCKENGDKILQENIYNYVEKRRFRILKLIENHQLYEMGKDGEPTWKRIEVSNEKASVLFHFRKNKEDTHYFQTIKLRDQKVDILKSNTYLLCQNPAWIISDGTLFTFKKNVDGNKLKPFLKKKTIFIPKNIEESYYPKFVAPLIAQYDVFAKGFNIVTERLSLVPMITISDLQQTRNDNLFNISTNGDDKTEQTTEDDRILIEISFKYGKNIVKFDTLNPITVFVEKENGTYVFHRICRDINREKSIFKLFTENGLPLKYCRTIVTRSEFFECISQNPFFKNVIINQKVRGKKFFLGESSMNLEINERIDWFDIKAKIQFGNYIIPFKKIREYIIQGKTEIILPNGEIGVIPEKWINSYKDLFEFSLENNGNIQLNKMHISLVYELNEATTKVNINKKLKKLLTLKQIDHYEIPTEFRGTLRPYQQAGYNWLRFLEDYNFGGCLADDMGLGKTIQTLALLQYQQKTRPKITNLIILPTSLIYNWEIEIKKFAPNLKSLIYAGPDRIKNNTLFSQYDIVMTSYAITRLDIEVFTDFYFNYIILDESQAIKNPNSVISKKVKLLKSRRRVILSGTPIENSTLDIWSQMNFLNHGLLGDENFFKKNYQIPIEKKKDQEKTRKLNAIIKPFLLRREKNQVARELPKKFVSIHYSTMSEDQKEIYESEKNAFRSKIMEIIEKEGMKKSHILLFQGLTRLRQISNHPKMIDEGYEGESGKLKDIAHKIGSSVSTGHNVLIFSQFVKHLKIVGELLKKQNIPFAYMDGSTKNRKEVVNQFQNDTNLPVFLISLKAGGTGFNLTKADYVFLLDPWWNPAVEMQAIDRTHRIGQTKVVFAYKFVTKDSIEEKIIALQKHKTELVSDLINIEKSFAKKLSKDDILNLFD